MRAAIYARFSSDLQNERSIEDQVESCRALAAREKLRVVKAFSDRAQSGSSLIGREGITAMLAAAAEQSFDVLICESMSRVGRDQEDRARVRKLLDFYEIKIITIADGLVSHLVDGVRAVVDAQQLLDLKIAIRRGLAGRVRDGLSGGGISYGYRKTEIGHRIVDDAQAAVVRRIFEEYSRGMPARAIAGRLNSEGVLSPRGGKWNASTIYGNQKRLTGILNNELYRGVIVWNRLRMIKVPDTNKRISRQNGTDKQVRREVPHLRIVDDETWHKVQAMRAAKQGIRPEHHRAPRRLLSGLIRCGTCGAGMASRGIHRGEPRLQCSAHRESGACTNGRSVNRQAVERMALDGLSRALNNRAMLDIYVTEYNTERRRLHAAEAGEQTRLERRKADVDRALQRATHALLHSDIDPQAIAGQVNALQAERSEIEASLERIAVTPADFVLKGDRIDCFRAEITALARGDLGPESIQAVRSLIESVTVFAEPGQEGLAIEVSGHLAALRSHPIPSIVGGSMVAGEGFQRSPTFKVRVSEPPENRRRIASRARP